MAGFRLRRIWSADFRLRRHVGRRARRRGQRDRHSLPAAHAQILRNTQLYAVGPLGRLLFGRLSRQYRAAVCRYGGRHVGIDPQPDQGRSLCPACLLLYLAVETLWQCPVLRAQSDGSRLPDRPAYGRRGLCEDHRRSGCRADRQRASQGREIRRIGALHACSRTDASRQRGDVPAGCLPLRNGADRHARNHRLRSLFTPERFRRPLDRQRRMGFGIDLRGQLYRFSQQPYLGESDESRRYGLPDAHRDQRLFRP